MRAVYRARNQQPADREWLRSAIIGALVSLPLVLFGGASAYVVFFQPTPTLEVVAYELPESEPQPVNLAWPDDGIAAIGAQGYGLLADDGNADEQVPIASITKLVTALAILQVKPIQEGETGELITFSAADEQRYADTISENGSAYPINAGDQLTQYEAMQALLIPSANNVADSMVEWAFGSETAFLAYVADMLTEMGLEQTVITDASGMSAGSVSTPRELIEIAQFVLGDPVLASIVRQPQATIDPAVGTILNTNQLLREQYVIGVKTGTTDAAGANLVFAAEYPLTEDISETIIGVTLGQSERSVNTTVSNQLLRGAFANFGFVEVVAAETAVARYEVPWGEDVELITNGGITVGGWLGKSYQPSAVIDELEPPVDINQAVGSLQVQAGERVSEVPVTTSTVVSEPSFFWRLRHIFSL